MTVVLGIRFSPASGILVADEQASYGSMRKADFRDKLYAPREDGKVPQLIVSASGQTDMILKTYDTYEASGSKGADAFVRAMHRFKSEYFDEYLRTKYGVSYEEYLSGSNRAGRSLNADVMREIGQTVSSGGGEINNRFMNEFIMLEPETMGFSVAGMLRVGRMPIGLPYVTTGSGSDAADGALSRFYDTVEREKRDEVSLRDGVRVALTAVDEATRKNLGVGGVPSIALVYDGGFYHPDQRQSLLAAEIVAASNRGLLRDGFVDDGLESLMTEENVFDEIDAGFKDAARDPRTLELALRGYIV